MPAFFYTHHTETLLGKNDFLTDLMYTRWLYQFYTAVDWEIQLPEKYKQNFNNRQVNVLLIFLR
jgi:hypothetical protein